MAIVLLLIAALVLTATMFVLTLGVNELEKKGSELSALLRKRYVVRPPAPKGKGPAGGHSVGAGAAGNAP